MKIFITICLLSGVAVAEDLQNCMKALENKNFENAIVCFKTAADNGNQIAQFNLAAMYNDGLGVKVDKDKSSRLLEMATDSHY